MSELLKGASLNRRSLFFVVVAAAIVAFAALAPATEGLPYEGRMVLCILAAGIVLWITESLPLPSTALLILVTMPIMGVCSFDEAYANSIGSTVFFLMGTFAFTVALDATSIPTRMVAAVLRWSGTDSRKTILGFMVACAVLSVVMSDVAACGVFISVGKRLLELNSAEKGKSKLGMAIMIAIPWASYAGGVASMAGNGCNVLTVNLFATLFGTEMNFVEWMMLGVPFALILLVMSWLVVVLFFKPEAISQESIDVVMAEVGSLGRLTLPEKKTVAVISLALVCWVLSSWVPMLNTAMVAIVAMVGLSIPGFNPLPFKELVSRMNWGVIIMIMSILSVAHFVVQTGAGEWIVNTVVAAIPEAARTPLVVLAIVSTIGAIMHNVVPVGPAVAGILAFPLGTIAEQFGIPMSAMLMVVAWQASISFVVPLDCVPILTYSTGYYRMTDMMKAGLLPTVILIALTVTLLPALCALFGLA